MVALFTKEFLFTEYIEKRKSTRQIGKENGRSNVAIGSWLKKFNIERRNGRESHLGQHSSPKTEFKKGQIPWNFKGEIERKGYLVVHLSKHPYSDKQGYVKKHRLVVEEEIKRYLLPNEKVHHINEVKTDNDLTNLILFSSESAHQRFHKNPDNVKPYEIIFDGRKL